MQPALLIRYISYEAAAVLLLAGSLKLGRDAPHRDGALLDEKRGTRNNAQNHERICPIEADSLFNYRSSCTVAQNDAPTGVPG